MAAAHCGNPRKPRATGRENGGVNEGSYKMAKRPLCPQVRFGSFKMPPPSLSQGAWQPPLLVAAVLRFQSHSTVFVWQVGYNVTFCCSPTFSLCVRSLTFSDM